MARAGIPTIVGTGAAFRLENRDSAQEVDWATRPLAMINGHFFAAAAEAVRRILTDQAGRNKSQIGLWTRQ